jgi:hypothetical protein
MNAVTKTLTFAAVAAVAISVALLTLFLNQPNTVDGFAEVGQPFFADFSDPTKATSLRVAVFDKDAQEATSFSVRQNDDGLWVIPSHHNYPAEAADRLARSAVDFIGVTKSAVQSRSKGDWSEFGVCDPTDDAASDSEECGTRVTLSDASGNSLADLIVGKPVPNREKTFYVREPEKNTTYLAELDVDLSAKFSDWIEPDLLKINETDIVQIVKDNYFIDEARGVVKQGETLTFEKEDLDPAGTWTLTDLDQANEEVVPSPISALARNIDQLKIVGIRPKPEGINADLTVSPNVANNPLLLQVLQADMQKQGFYVAPGTDDKIRLFSNEGEVIAGTDKGVEYTLYFGEIARGSARDLEIGFAEDAEVESTTVDDAADDEDATADESDAEDGLDSADGPRRYLLVKVDFNESLLGPKPVEPVAPTLPEILKQVPEANTESGDVPKKSEGDSDEPAADNPAADEPAADEPAADKPAADEPADDEPADEACLIDEPTSRGDEKTGDEPPASTDAPSTEEAKQESPPASDEPTESTESTETTETTTTDPTSTSETPAADPATAKPVEDQESDEATDKPAADAPVADEPAAKPVDPRIFAQQEFDAAMGEYEAGKRTWVSDTAAWEERSKEGQKIAEDLGTRYAGWYYVISAESFDKFKITRMDVTKKKEEESADGTDASAPDITPPFSIPKQ